MLATDFSQSFLRHFKIYLDDSLLILNATTYSEICNVPMQLLWMRLVGLFTQIIAGNFSSFQN